MKRILILLYLIGTCSLAQASSPTNTQAREIFIQVFNSIFNSEGCQLSYDVNITGIYKTKGSIAYKGKKQQFNESRICSWNNGVTIHKVDLKKKVVHIYRVGDENSDKYMSKFKFDPDDFTYSIKEDADYYEITAKLKNSKMFGVKDATARLTKNGLVPVNLRVKVAFLHANVAISNFKTGSLSDQIFEFPKDRFKNYKIEDHRNE